MKKLLFFEPNKLNESDTDLNAKSSFRPPEDLSIYVDLEAKSKGRSVITLTEKGSTTVRNSLANLNVKFFEGSKTGEKVVNGKTIDDRNLTTNYTTPSFIDDPNKTSDSESLGIESIDIDFDTAYTPVIKIKLIDVRGNAIISKGNKSKYASFFELPYPIFSLTVKGYYGRPVKYCLHLLKWGSKFNSDTGNFEINAEFIGFTYAILTDMLLGLCRAVVYTNIGKTKFQKIKDEYAKGGIKLFTIDEFISKSNQISLIYQKLKNDDSGVKELETIKNTYEEIKNVVEQVNKQINLLIKTDKNNKKGDFFSNGGITVTPNSDYNRVRKSIVNYSVNMGKTIDSVNANIDNKDFKIKKENVQTPIEVLNTTITNYRENNEDELCGLMTNFNGSNEEKETRVSKYSELVNGLIDKSVSGDIEVNLFDFSDAYTELDRVVNTLKKRESTLNEELSTKLQNIASEELDFDPTIRNIFRLLTTHCEVLVETIHQVGVNAEKNASRIEAIKRLGVSNSQGLNGVTKIKNSDEIYPFPEYKKIVTRGDNSKALEERWIGEDLSGSDYNKVDEVVFIEDLLNKLISIAAKDEKPILSENEANLGFFPISVLDLKIFRNPNNSIYEKINPYNDALLNSKSRRVPKEIYRALLIRNFMYQAVNNIELTNNDVILQGKFEAENLFNVLKNDIDKDKASEIVNEIVSTVETTGSEKSSKMSDYIIKGFSSGGEFTKNDKEIIDSNPQNYIYRYISLNGKSLMPTTTNFDRVNLISSGNTTTVDSLIEKSKENHFISNDYVNQLDDKSNIFEIISVNEYRNLSNTVTFGSDVVSEYKKLKGDKNYILQSKLEKDGPLSLNSQVTDSGVQEFFYIKYDGKGRYENNYTYDTKGLEPNVGPSSLVFWNHIDNSNILLNNDNAFGNYLTKYVKFENKTGDKTDLYCNENSTGDIEYINSINDRIEHTFLVKPTSGVIKNTDSYDPNYGFQRRYIGELRNDLNTIDNSLIYTPKIEFLVNDKYFSLFSSNLYNNQTDIGKAFLFLHTFGWAGMIQDTSLIINNDTDIFENDKALIKDIKAISGLFDKQSALVKVPKLWVAFIGGLLHRMDSNTDIINFIDSEGTTYVPFMNKLNLPKLNEYLTIANNTHTGLSFSESNDKYLKLDDTLKTLSVDIKNKFKVEFFKFVDGDENSAISSDFDRIKENFEIYKNYSKSNVNDFILQFDSKITNRRTNTFKYGALKKEDYDLIINNNINLLNDNFYKLFDNVLPVMDLWNPTNKHHELNLRYLPNSKGSIFLNNLIIEEVIICNGSPYNFKRNKTGKPNVIEDLHVNKEKFKLLTTSFFERFFSLSKNFGTDKETDDLEKKIFKSTNNEDIKLNLYRTISSIYKKWVTDTEGIFSQCEPCKYDSVVSENERNSAKARLIDSFRFLDRAFNDIGNIFYLNPLKIVNMLRNNYNQSFFDLVNKILSDNNFNFIPLPSFINFTKQSELEDMFKTYSYNDVSNGDIDVGPSFVCTYIGQTSTNLDLNEFLEPDDGIFFGPGETIPSDFQGDRKNDGSLTIPMFNVAYARQNQSIFKDISLDQTEFSETAESLEIIEDISKGGDKRSPKYVGQNLFNVYQKRSYSCEIEMMGNAMMQPMSYFHLSDIPMFRGAYIITKISHSITPNNMTTKIKGTRVKFNKTKLVESSTIFMDLLESLESNRVDTTNSEIEKIKGESTNSGPKSPTPTSDLPENKRGIKII